MGGGVLLLGLGGGGLDGLGGGADGLGGLGGGGLLDGLVLTAAGEGLLAEGLDAGKNLLCLWGGVWLVFLLQWGWG